MLHNENDAVGHGSDSVEMHDMSVPVKSFNFDQCFNMISLSSQSKRCRAMEELMRHLVTVPINMVSEEIKNPRSKFGQIVAIIQDRFIRREDHSSMKTVEL